MNPIMQSIGNTAGAPMANMMGNALANNPMFQSVKQMMNMFRTMQNPQAALAQMAQSNPQVAQVMQMVQGKNPQDVFNEQCKAHGLNPEQAMKQIQNMLNSN